MTPEATCPPEFLQGIEEFNRQEFFQCHETLEHFWRNHADPDREFTQGIIQIAVAFYHLSRGNQAGASKLLNRGLPRIRSYSPSHYGVDVDALVDALSPHLQSGLNQEPLAPPQIRFLSQSDR